jgi:Domain of unknown function (DUF4328)/zinc-ribbon domain
VTPCPACGAQPLPDARFCAECGAPLGGAVEERRLHDPSRLGKVAIGLVAGVLVADFAGLALHASRMLEARQILHGELVTPATLRAADHRLTAVTAIRELLYVVAGIVLIAWLWRCYRNARAVSGSTDYGIPWAIFGWIVPIASLFMPLLVVRDALARSLRPDEDAAPVPTVVPVWWALYLGSVLAGLVLRVSWPRADTAHQLERLDAAWVGVDLVRIAAAAATIAVILELTRRQRRWRAADRAA